MGTTFAMDDHGRSTLAFDRNQLEAVVAPVPEAVRPVGRGPPHRPESMPTAPIIGDAAVWPVVIVLYCVNRLELRDHRRDPEPLKNLTQPTLLSSDWQVS